MLYCTVLVLCSPRVSVIFHSRYGGSPLVLLAVPIHYRVSALSAVVALCVSASCGDPTPMQRCLQGIFCALRLLQISCDPGAVLRVTHFVF
jgi:hypothetical protein